MAAGAFDDLGALAGHGSCATFGFPVLILKCIPSFVLPFGSTKQSGPNADRPSLC